MSYGLKCSISSNLNVLKDPYGLMAAELDWFRVSVSGFTQSVYELGHVGGSIANVKENMRLISLAKSELGANTDLELFFHKYKDNEKDELLMQEYAQALGFRFTSAWAYLMPVEKMLSIYNPDKPMVNLSEEDLNLVDRLALTPEQSLGYIGTQSYFVWALRLFNNRY